MPVYTVKNNLRHNGERYNAGDTVEMSPAAAKPLLAMGIIAAAPKGKGKEEPEQETVG